MASRSQNHKVGWSSILTKAHSHGLALVSMSIWLPAADSLIVATMMRAIVDDIGGEAIMAWTVALYETGSIVASAIGGLVSIRFGIRTPMRFSALLFALGCLISAASPDMWLMLLGRFLQGLGGGSLIALSFVSVSMLFKREFVPRVMAIVSTIWGVSVFLGPLIGSFFVQFANWRLAFSFFAIQAVVLAAGTAFNIEIRGEANRHRTGEGLPILRLGLLSVGIVLIASGGIEVSAFRTISFVASGLLCLAIFIRLDSRHTRSRLLPHGPFNLGTRHGAALLMILSLSMGTIAITAYGPVIVAIIHDASTLTAGYVLACASMGWTVMAVLVSGTVERHDSKLIFFGALSVFLSILGFAYAVPNGPVWMIAIFSVMQGGGFGMAWTFILRRATSLAPPTEVERISAAIPTIQRLGFALGAAYIGIIANAAGFAEAVHPDEFIIAAKAIFAAGVPLGVIGLACATRFVARA